MIVLLHRYIDKHNRYPLFKKKIYDIQSIRYNFDNLKMSDLNINLNI